MIDLLHCVAGSIWSHCPYPLEPLRLVRSWYLSGAFLEQRKSLLFQYNTGLSHALSTKGWPRTCLQSSPEIGNPLHYDHD